MAREIERERAARARDQWAYELQAQVAALQTKNERLRSALQKIMAESPTRLTVGEWSPVDVSEIARAALEHEQP